jgi:myo-inositol-1(or 4)-monophosphatase
VKNLPDINELVSIVREIAQQHLMPHFGHISREYKADKSIVTAADLATQKALISELKSRWPDFDFLAEEMTAEEQEQHMAQAENGLWIVDPLDGTSNFAAGIPYFAISIALYYKGSVKLGLVYDPNRDEAFTTTDTSESTLNGHALKPADTPAELARAIGVIDFKRLPPELATKLVTQQPFSSQRSFGSVALDWCWLAANRFHVYLHGRSNIWDYAAGELIFRQAGGHSCTLDGEAIFQPTVKPRSAVGALDKDYFRQWTQFLSVNT